MKNSILISLSVTLFLITSVFNPAFAQTKNQTGNIDKFEIAVDLQELFSEGYPNKVLFKINNIKNNQIKGAYRIGVDASYWVDKYKITHDDENFELTSKEQRSFLSLSAGYELHKNLNRAVFYYGADLGGLISIKDNIDYPNVDEFYTLFLVPFAGVKVFLSNNLSLAFEGGLMNSFNWSKSEGGDVNPDNRQFHSFYQSQLKLPYSLTFNFNF